MSATDCRATELDWSACRAEPTGSLGTHASAITLCGGALGDTRRGIALHTSVHTWERDARPVSMEDVEVVAAACALQLDVHLTAEAHS